MKSILILPTDRINKVVQIKTYDILFFVTSARDICNQNILPERFPSVKKQYIYLYICIYMFGGSLYLQAVVNCIFIHEEMFYCISFSFSFFC